MSSVTLVLPLEDPKQMGATEHVQAIMKELDQGESAGLLLLPPQPLLKGSTGETSLEALKARCTEIKGQMEPEDKILVVSGLYGAQEAEDGKSFLEIIKEYLGPDKVKTLLSTHSFEDDMVVEQFEAGTIDRLALPAFAVEPSLIGETKAALIAANEERIIRMPGVPHLATKEHLLRKKLAWDLAAEKGVVPALPPLAYNERLLVVVLPGDVVEGADKVKFYTEQNARDLAISIFENFLQPKTDDLRSDYKFPTTLVVTDGPRTFKYNSEAIANNRASFHPNDLSFQNEHRFDAPGSNPVTKAFVDCVQELSPETRLIIAGIVKGRTPPQAFFATYQYLNDHAVRGGEAVALIDAASISMLTQASDVLDPTVTLIAADTPAKFALHKAGVRWLCDQGYLHILKRDGSLVSCPAPLRDTTHSDAQIVATVIKTLYGAKPPSQQVSSGCVATLQD